MLNFGGFLPLKEPFLTTFCEMCALTSRKFVSETGMINSDLFEKLQHFCLDSLGFALENKL